MRPIVFLKQLIDHGVNGEGETGILYRSSGWNNANKDSSTDHQRQSPAPSFDPTTFTVNENHMEGAATITDPNAVSMPTIDGGNWKESQKPRSIDENQNLLLLLCNQDMPPSIQTTNTTLSQQPRTTCAKLSFLRDHCRYDVLQISARGKS